MISEEKLVELCVAFIRKDAKRAAFTAKNISAFQDVCGVPSIQAMVIYRKALRVVKALTE